MYICVCVCVCGIRENGIDDLIYKAEIETQTYRANVGRASREGEEGGNKLVVLD